MKKTSLLSVMLFTLALTMLSACGGGSSSSTPPPTTAILTLSTAVTVTFPVTTTINSYNVTITLPPGVTVKTMPSSSATGTGVVTASGKALGAAIDGVYTAATGTFPGTVKVYVASATGFAAGEFCTVTANIGSGSPTVSSFVPLKLDDATGIDTITISTVPGLQGNLSLSATARIY